MDELGLGTDNGDWMKDLQNMGGDQLPPGAIGMNDGMANQVNTGGYDMSPETRIELQQCIKASSKKEKSTVCMDL